MPPSGKSPGDPEPEPGSTSYDVSQAKQSLGSPSWNRLSARIADNLRRRFGRTNLPATLDFDDFVSEVMLLVLRDIRKFEDRGPGAFWAWVQRLAQNRLQDLRRHYEARRRGGDVAIATGNADQDPLDSIPDADPLTATAFVRIRELEQVEMDCVVRLPQEMRDVYLLRRRDERPFVEIAAAVGRRNQVTVRSLYQRARDYVRRCIEAKTDDLGTRIEGW